MRKSKRYEIKHNSEFELDLAPLLAVMVKLVPVLLVSTAFVQTSIIQSDLPQVVKQQINENLKNDKATQVSLYIGKSQGFEIQVTKDGKTEVVKVGLKSNQLDYQALQQAMIKIKQSHPEVFSLQLRPDADVPYNQIVKVIDEVRAPEDKNIKFPITDKTTGEQKETDLMFPDVVFANMLEG